MSAAEPTQDHANDFVPDHDRLRARYAERLRQAGVPNADVAAAVAATRGRAGETVEAFAARLRVEPDVVVAAEGGEIPWNALPDSLVKLFSSG